MAGHRKRRRVSSAIWLAVVPAGALLVGLTVYAFHGARPAPARPSARTAQPAGISPRNLVVASLPYWNIGQGTSAVLTHRWAVDEVSPWMYGLSNNGRIVLDSGINAPAFTSYLDRLRAQGLPIVPTLANVDPAGNWSYRLAARMLHHPALMAKQVSAIVALVQQGRYAGIDLDYEELHAGDRAAFTMFVTRLATALHAVGKILSVALFAKASDAGYAPRNVAQDYAAIGRAADQVRLMGYDYHWNTSPPGPIAPVSWIRAVLRYATTQIPARKIILGIPCYGYDWTGHHGAPVTWMQAVKLASDHHATVRYDTSGQAPWFTYRSASGTKHTVWFENAESSKAKFSLARAAGLGGVYLWMYGNGEPSTWSALRQVLPAGTRAAVKVAP
ncbi:MAG TPA: peptidoglycan hydrolase [Actinobacteria bacterium]|nr:peptidoglycan hydrolase [Actinomycetota bacterium]